MVILARETKPTTSTAITATSTVNGFRTLNLSIKIPIPQNRLRSCLCDQNKTFTVRHAAGKLQICLNFTLQAVKNKAFL